ncbi:MAG: hypothetical protein A3I05_08945 [Deltaproteobacteria bacterium RIFCSPLOWO2_02_FULL_44_10]|nr:MAG: hypothetical protein A3C46_08670 [Deltaproteobacteria bacterium RIFCSPHIGHO2_02_FULL_44_16]OGQ45233.1 MAG: hypothetical protein A3I05_08945 [Deltaproteobacteria bacterium RIFCSPLOWO2_02_FULL_44_10]
MIRWILLGCLLYFFYRLWIKASAGKTTADRKKNLPGEMIACTRCGTYILKSSAHEKQNKLYCGASCASEEQ